MVPVPLTPVFNVVFPARVNTLLLTIALLVVSAAITFVKTAEEFSPVMLISSPSAVSLILVIFRFVKLRVVPAFESSKPDFEFILRVASWLVSPTDNCPAPVVPKSTAAV